MEVQFWATTDTGRVRDHNEDNFLVDSDLNLFVVCDGMGGHAAGEVASALSVRTIHQVVSEQAQVLEEFEREPSNPARREAVLDLLERAVTEASNRVYAAAQRDSERNGMGTTCDTLLVLAGHGFVGHVGDSRIYRRRGAQAEQLTDDHSLLNEMIRQGRAKEGDSIPNQNAVTRAVGVRDSVVVDTFDFAVEPGDRFLLCSDGLSGYIEDDAQLRELMDGEDLESAAHRCIQHALQAGGKDNITAILVGIGADANARQTRMDSSSLEYLAGCPYFAHATPSELAQLSDLAERHGFDAGATIIEQGKPADALCVIVKGSVGVIGPDASVTVLDAGQSFGAVSLLSASAAQEAYEALEPTRLLVFRREPLFEALRDRPELAAKVMFGLATSLADQLHRVPAELRFEPERWDEVSIQGDQTPAPGALVVKDLPHGKKKSAPKAASRDSKAVPAIPPAAKQTAGIDELDEFDPEDLRTTIQLDLNDDSVEEL